MYVYIHKDHIRMLWVAGAFLSPDSSRPSSRSRRGTTLLMFAACGNALLCLTELLRMGSKKARAQQKTASGRVMNCQAYPLP